jgi:hypothetical protein
VGRTQTASKAGPGEGGGDLMGSTQATSKAGPGDHLERGTPATLPDVWLCNGWWDGGGSRALGVVLPRRSPLYPGTSPRLRLEKIWLVTCVMAASRMC